MLDTLQQIFSPDKQAAILAAIALYSVVAATFVEGVKRILLHPIFKRIVGEEYTISPVTMKVLAAATAAVLAWFAGGSQESLPVWIVVSILSAIGASTAHNIAGMAKNSVVGKKE